MKNDYFEELFKTITLRQKSRNKNSCLAFFLEKDNKISVIFSLLKKIYMFF